MLAIDHIFLRSKVKDYFCHIRSVPGRFDFYDWFIL